VAAVEHRRRATGSNLRFLNSAITFVDLSVSRTH
jgi:hypothetical protein